MTPEERYLNYPWFHALVDSLVAQLNQCETTITELRQAVILAAQIHERTKTTVQLDSITGGSK
jgi:hypothetical protein